MTGTDIAGQTVTPTVAALLSAHRTEPESDDVAAAARPGIPLHEVAESAAAHEEGGS